MDLGGIAMGLWRAAEVLLALLPAVVALRLVRSGLQPGDAAARLALGAGLAFGVALLLALPHGEAFRPARIFATDGPWRIGLPDFLAQHALPGRATLHGAATGLPAGCGLLLLGAGILAAARAPRSPALRRLAMLLPLAAGMALLLHYAVHLLAWMLALLNFWLFALALFAFQRRRYAAPRGDHRGIT